MKANTDGLTMNQLAERNAEHVTTIAALESRCASLSAKLSMINDLMEVAEQANKLAQEAAEKLVQERNTLAAENAGLNKFIAASCFVQAGEELAWYPAIDHAPETPATDAFLAEVRAKAHKEGAYFVANRMLAAWDAGFIDDTAKNAADIARMILTSTEFMADAPEGDFDRSFADGVLEGIAAQLRKGVQS
ncbi:Eae-like protein [Salmonella enterica subsp. enterica serovar Pomona]|uniref:Eae-like protein n=1 Tax=Salmonella enterica TaxID=28901 RepID=A0A744HC77_SALER|nr:Eae-like protein [Salmonella enterica subsp. enterica serovar Pomona]EAP2255489.1 Eae-like protein [Salmonella enterica]EBR9558152.1 Eae-like protein [Salmonella enterica subsp. enterica serovar Pomona]EBW2504419.1 Eae-like protein [Salmonella enterica subsp. enterica serovar Pomona]EBZ8417172.1 Eae-like protein [Salmonella enterica subsp. enterica serovar Pomona]